MKLTEELRTARAAYERQLAAELKEHAARSVQPPTGAQVLDLWAHLRNIRDDGTAAWVLIHKILDIGWRPMGTVPAGFPREVVTNPRDEEPLTNPDDYEADLFSEAS